MIRRLVLLSLLFVPVIAWAHTPLLVVEDNEDGTIFVEAGFSNGASAAGTNIILKSKAGGEVLWEGTVPEEGCLDVEMPSEPYTVTLDAGPGHVVTKDGPEPAGGFGGEASSSSDTAEVVPSPAAEPAGDAVAWTPATTMGAVPPSPPTGLEILRVVLMALQVLVLGYIAILIKRSKQ